MPRPPLPLIALLVLTPPVFGEDDRAAAVKSQKAKAAADLAKAGVSRPGTAETDDLIVFATLPETKTKALADTLQKTFQITRTTLKFGEDKLWPGKLTVIVLTDPVPYGTFIRQVEQRRPEKGVAYSKNLRSDQPYVIESVEPGEKPTDAELTADAAALVAAALLNKKAGAGASMPEWLEFGFGRTMAVRADGNTGRLATHRTKVKAAVLGTKGKASPARLADLWGGQKSKDGDLAASSFVEFLAFGPYAEKFPSFLSAFKVSDERPMPTVQLAFADLEWSADALEVAWKQWVLKQK